MSVNPREVTSPKVTATAIGGSLTFLFITLLCVVLDSVDASWFEGLSLSPALIALISGLATAAVGVIRGWRVADPLRENYETQLARQRAQDRVNTGFHVAPDADQPYRDQGF